MMWTSGDKIQNCYLHQNSIRTFWNNLICHGFEFLLKLFSVNRNELFKRPKMFKIFQALWKKAIRYQHIDHLIALLILLWPKRDQNVKISGSGVHLLTLLTLFFLVTVKANSLYVMQNEFLRVPEFTEHYRNLSSHASKSWEDPILMQLIRSLAGLSDLAHNKGCNFSLPSENDIRQNLQIDFQERKITAKMVTSYRVVTIGQFMPRKGLRLEAEYQNQMLPGQGQGQQICYCTCQNMNLVPLDSSLKVSKS